MLQICLLCEGTTSRYPDSSEKGPLLLLCQALDLSREEGRFQKYSRLLDLVRFYWKMLDWTAGLASGI